MYSDFSDIIFRFLLNIKDASEHTCVICIICTLCVCINFHSLGINYVLLKVDIIKLGIKIAIKIKRYKNTEGKINLTTKHLTIQKMIKYI